MSYVACWQKFDAWRNGWRVLRLAQCASFFCSTRTSEVFAETRSRTRETYCLRRADVTFFRGRVQLGVAQWSTTDRVKVRFLRSQGRPVAQRGGSFARSGGFTKARRGRWRCRRSYARVDVLLFVFALVGSTGGV